MCKSHTELSATFVSSFGLDHYFVNDNEYKVTEINLLYLSEFKLYAIIKDVEEVNGLRFCDKCNYVFNVKSQNLK